MKSVALISGGIDSFVAAAVEKQNRSEIYALSISYGQLHKKELESAKQIGRFLSVTEHRFIILDLSWLPSSLTDPNYKPEFSESAIPPSYVPARNIIFLSLALAYAESIDADAIVIGVHTIDYSGYPDCRPEFIESFQKVINVGIKRTVEGKEIVLKTPLLRLRKSEIIRIGLNLGLDFSITWSCYRGREKACGECDSCRIRLAAFSEAGIKDPVEYENTGG